MSVFYGWKISLLSLGGNFMLQGAALYCMNAFMEPLCEAHGWTRMGLNFSLGIAALMGQLAMPVAAAICARYSLRMLMGLGAMAGGVATCAMGFCDNINLFTVFFVIVWIASQFCGGVAANALMSNWFHRYRGVALALANSGTSLSGMTLPFIALLLIQSFDIRAAFLCLGIATCALAPLSWWIVRREPGMLHLYPDGRGHAPKTGHHVAVNTTLSRLARDPATWQIGIAFGLALMCASGIMSQLKPRFSDSGIDQYYAMIMVSVASLFGTLSKYLWGWLCDRFSAIFAGRLLIVVCLCGVCLLFLPPTTIGLLIFGIIFGSAGGGIWVVLPAVVASYFGSENFLGVFKFVSIFILLRSLGFPVMGISHQYFSSYVFADMVFAGGLLIALVLLLLLNPAKAAEKNKPRVKKHRS